MYRRTGEKTRSNDVWLGPLGVEGAPTAILDSAFDENYAVLSPDGRSMAYVSDESGQPEVYVMSLTGGGGKSQLSTGGGTFPRWRRDGREIVYLGADQMLLSALVSGSGPQFQAASPKPLFRMEVHQGPGTPFDVSADGQRFIVDAAIPSKASPSLGLVVNWPSLVH